MKKRIISLAIALLLVCGMPVSAFAMGDNPADKFVPEIPAGDSMNSNYGTVTINNGTVTTNNGYVKGNEGTIDTNNGTVDTNNGTVDTNNGTVSLNSAPDVNANANTKVNTNNGTVDINIGTIDTNNGTVDANYGTVDTNNGTVNDNEGTVNTNSITGNVTNYEGGTVNTNYGTVIDAADNYKTTYGVQIDNDGTVALEQKEKGDEIDFSQLTKDGYEFAGYTQEYQMLNGVLTKQAITVNGTSYTADCPNILTLIWRAIAGYGESDGYFGPGCYISVNGRQYILVEIKDGDYYLASCDEYTKEQLSDIDALLASLLTAEQLDCVTGKAGILNAEQAETFFGGGSHIVFPCSKYLIFS